MGPTRQLWSVGPARQLWSRDPPSPPAGPAGQPFDRRVGTACQVGPMRGTRVSGRTDVWDPRVRSHPHGTLVSSQTRPAWHPHGSSDRTHMGPACQVGPNPRVRLDRCVRPVCQVRPTCGTCVSGWTYRWDPYVRLV
jgi:hypothetical protein